MRHSSVANQKLKERLYFTLKNRVARDLTRNGNETRARRNKEKWLTRVSHRCKRVRPPSCSLSLSHFLHTLNCLVSISLTAKMSKNSSKPSIFVSLSPSHLPANSLCNPYVIRTCHSRIPLDPPCPSLQR